MEVVLIIILMEADMLDFGKMAKNMDKDFWMIFITENNMMELGSMDKNMARDIKNMPTVTHMKE